jgi:hypothetical protein
MEGLMWTTKELLCLFIVTSTIIKGRFNMDSQGIIICLFIVTRTLLMADLIWTIKGLLYVYL